MGSALTRTCMVRRVRSLGTWDVDKAFDHMIPMATLHACARFSVLLSGRFLVSCCFMAGKPPAARRGHVAAAVEDKVYVWGGLLGYTGVSHDGPDKTDIIVKVDVLDLKVRRGATCTVGLA